MTYGAADLVEFWCRENNYLSQVSFQYPMDAIGPKLSFITINRPTMGYGITLRFVGNLRVEWRKNDESSSYLTKVLGNISDPDFFFKLEQIMEDGYGA